MGSISNTLKPLRIIAFPLTRAIPPQQPLIYYHFQISRPALPVPKQESRIWAPAGGWSAWTTGKAGKIWAGYKQAEEGTWKRRIYQAGERLVDRIDFEELALKGIVTPVGPSKRPLGFGGRSKDEIKNESSSKITLLYPPSIQNAQETMSNLMSLIRHRTPKHRMGFYTWMAITPLTAPLKLIPIIPNLPFFFCVWRSWHHYRAYRASQYIQTLLDDDSIQPESSHELDQLYTDYIPKPLGPDAEQNPELHRSSSLLLTRDVVPALLEKFSLSTDDATDFYRALDQARLREQKSRAPS